MNLGCKLLSVSVSCLLVSGAEIPLTVPAGAPLTVSLEKKVPMRAGAPVKARVTDPVFAYDKMVIPAGSEVTGAVTRLDHVTRMRRVNAIFGGDFTPLKDPQVRFDTLVLPGGERMAIHTSESSGLGIVVHAVAPVITHKRKTVLGKGLQQVRDEFERRRLDALENAHAGNKWERVQAAAYSRLPYHPQFLFTDTRFHSVLDQPLQFGTEASSAETTDRVGTSPPPGSVVSARLLKDLSSADAHQGTPVEAVVSQPLFSGDHHLILPEGTKLTGAVVKARRARWFRRGGQLRFVFQQIEPPAGTAPVAAYRVDGNLLGIDAERNANVKVDEEGGMQAKPSNTRFIAPVVSLLLASRPLDQDKNHDGQVGRGTSARTFAGGVGFGLLGSIAGQSSRSVAAGFGFWGVAVSVYTHILARGDELVFPTDTNMEVRFGREAKK